MSAAEVLPWVVIVLGAVLIVAQIALDFTIANRKAGGGHEALDAGAKEVLLKLAEKSPLMVGGIVLLLFGALFTGQFSFSAGALQPAPASALIASFVGMPAVILTGLRIGRRAQVRSRLGRRLGDATTTAA